MSKQHGCYMVFSQGIFDYKDITKDMIEMFDKKHERHVYCVRSYIKYFVDIIVAKSFDKYEFSKDDTEKLIERSMYHDKSRTQPNEYLPHVLLEWKRTLELNNNEVNFSDLLETDMKTAIVHHCVTNRHHPEFHDRQMYLMVGEDIIDYPKKKIGVIVNCKNMTHLDMVEMIADWSAEVFGTNRTVREYASTVVGIKWKFDTEQVELIRDLCSLFNKHEIIMR